MERRDHTPTPGPAFKYKRSWKNLLINKKYQLRFTLFMVGLSSALMIGLGLWVMRVANETTEVSATSVRGTPCPKIPTIEEAEPLPPVPMKLEDPAKPAEPPPEPAPAPDEGSAAPDDGGEPTGADADADAGSADEPPRRATIEMDESSIRMMPSTATVPADLAQKAIAHWTCELKLAGKLDRLERGRLRILLVLIGTGLLLVLGLAIYGLKMTHKVAGPLFKVGLYLGKMRNGRFDKVYNLRKGDQLVDFYEHFKHAHGGIVQMEKDDIARVKAVIAAAEAAGIGEQSTVTELREIVARKEKSVE